MYHILTRPINIVQMKKANCDNPDVTACPVANLTGEGHVYERCNKKKHVFNSFTLIYKRVTFVIAIT